MRNSLLEMIINYLLDSKNFQEQFSDSYSKEYCKEMDFIIEKLRELKN